MKQKPNQIKQTNTQIEKYIKKKNTAKKKRPKELVLWERTTLSTDSCQQVIIWESGLAREGKKC